MLPSQSTQSSTSAHPDYLQCSHEVVCGMIEAASAALFAHFPQAAGDTLDVELLLDALRVLRPKVAEIGMLDGLLHIVHGRWDDAAHALRAVIDMVPDFAYAKALMAYCLASKGDPGWRRWASDAVESAPNGETLALVRALEAREDLHAAMRDYRGGEFVIPQTCQSLVDEARAAEQSQPAASGSLPVPDPQFGYLRA
ncbi:HrpB1 family type III secretion system apparatus protein [Burkholderia sp. SCN-KJ]|uniref:HrpB1 family type III secretion system apparatus protein n=1 Tax=Burkholderia sp. SCN-KJ TaxID=2969248 RepID=UPI0021500ADA|nr:HrpB1 family type III secretion system apparatus protein [Burkholderia sp. SCN-KJ]MCR4468326.1 HrpB1 family type III secretion system apparatus protein [Burkholderia sp. SCN-KJ]